MVTRLGAVDAYIAKAPPFARPILERIREAFHAGAPEVVEAMKWGVPSFEYKGPLGNMAAFKEHVRWGFWKSKLMKDPEATGIGAKKVTDVSELPPKRVLVEYVREAVRLNDAGAKVARGARKAVTVKVPADFQKALAGNRGALENFKDFAPSHRREYVEWIEEAKKDETRQKRIATAVEWIAEGKSRNWKYERK
jgi:hypothetical protein